MSKQTRQTVKDVRELVKANKGKMSINTLRAAMVKKLGHNEVSVGSFVSAAAKSRLVRRYKDPKGKTWVYLRGVEVPEGCVDYGYSMLKNRAPPKKVSTTSALPDKLVPPAPAPVPAKTAIITGLTLSFSSNGGETTTCTIAEARSLGEEFKALFGG